MRLDVGLELGGNLRAELEPPVLLVLRVVPDEEPPAVGMELPVEFDDLPAHRQHPVSEVQVADPQFGQFTPAQPALDVGLDEKLHRAGRQRQVELVELLWGHDPAGLPGDRRGFHSPHGMQVDDVVERGGENRAKNRLAVADHMRRDLLILQVSDPLPDVGGHDLDHPHRAEPRQDMAVEVIAVVLPRPGLHLMVW